MFQKMSVMLVVCALLHIPQIAAAQGDAIMVRGHWRIDVRQPDGTLVSHREFENHLIGTVILAAVLSRASVVGAWAIHLAGSGGPCFADLRGEIRPCVIAEPPTPRAENYFPTLAIATGPSLTAQNPYAPKEVLILTGSAVAERDGSIERVQTTVQCVPECASDGFTSTTLPTPQAVEVGQIIQVTVRISFH